MEQPSSYQPLQCEFENVDLWAKRYQRNNKRCGLKNLRCFPYCLDKHRVKGFCGRAVTFHIRDNNRNLPYWSWAEFRKAGDPGTIKVGTILSQADITEKERTRTHNNRPWYVGQIPGSGDNPDRTKESIAFQFNNQKKGWSYSWAANKHTCNLEHCLQVYVFTEYASDPTRFVCVGVHFSPKFTLFCRRRPNALSTSQNSVMSVETTATANESDAFPVSPGFDRLNLNLSPASMMSSSSSPKSILHSRAMAIKREDSLGKLSSPHSPVGSPKRPYPFAPCSAPTMTRPSPEFGGMDSPTVVRRSFHRSDSRVVLNAAAPQHDHIDLDFDFSETFAEDSHNNSNNTGLDASPADFLNNDQKQWPKQRRVSSEAPLAPQHPVVDFDLEAEEAEKALNARLWRLTVILDLLEARWNEDCLATKKVTTASTNAATGEPVISMAGFDFSAAALENHVVKEEPGTATNNYNVAAKELTAVLQDATTQQSMEDEFDAEFAVLDADYDFVGDFLDAPMTPFMDESFEEKQQSRTRVLDEFGRYLIFESDITSDIQQAFSVISGTSPMDSAQKLKASFMQIMNVYLGKFLHNHNMSLKEFEDLIGESMKDKQIDPISRRPHAVSRFRMLLQHMRYSPTDEEIGVHMAIPKNNLLVKIPENLDLSGTWVFDDAITNALSVIREMRGVPWILRKMLAQQEEQFTIKQVPHKVFFQYKRKMLSNGFIAYDLDGKQNQWTGLSPIPWTKPLVYSTRASFESDHYRFEHYYNPSTRSKRLFRKSMDGQQLEIIVAIQSKDPKSMIWEDQFSARGVAYRQQV